jgi:UDP-2,3-diacylglucosamine pyrophosphatase LpxH
MEATVKQRYRTVWVSDLHLGTPGCRAEDLSRWLKRIECDHLYLVGDIIDMWRLRNRWYWPAEHNRVVRRLLKLAHRGTRIVYIPGNHDDAARQFAGMEFGGIRIELTALHETADGRSLLVTHGDQYDLVIRHSPLLSKVGGIGYETLLKANRWWNRGRAAFGLPYHSLSRAIKLKVKQACTFISRFEENVALEAVGWPGSNRHGRPPSPRTRWPARRIWASSTSTAATGWRAAPRSSSTTTVASR